MKKGAALLLAVLLCVLCGCAQPVRARQKTQITLINGWGDSSLDGDRIQELYARFNEENDDIQLNFLTLANTEAVVKVAEDMLVVGRQPDISRRRRGGAALPLHCGKRLRAGPDAVSAKRPGLHRGRRTAGFERLGDGGRTALQSLRFHARQRVLV